MRGLQVDRRVADDRQVGVGERGEQADSTQRGTDQPGWNGAGRHRRA